MAGFDAYAAEFSAWVEHVNPPDYAGLMDGLLPQTVACALDAGCGPGKLSLYFSQKARLVVAVDISIRMLELTRAMQIQQKTANIQLLQADLNTSYLKPGSFDLVGSDCTLHATQLEQSLPALRNLIRPGGWLVVRDLVTRHPRRARSYTWQILGTCRRAPGYVAKFGATETVRLLSFELSPAWIRHNCTTRHLTREEFRGLFQDHLPGCRFADQGWAMTAIWQAPG